MARGILVLQLCMHRRIVTLTITTRPILTAYSPDGTRKNRHPDMWRAQRDLIAMRRAAISALIPRCLTLHELAAELARQGIKNPKTQKPYSIFIISIDLRAIREGWARMVAVPPEEHRAKQFGEIQAIKREAWRNNNGGLALKALKLEMELTGTISAVNVNLNINVDIVQRLVKVLMLAGLDPTSTIEEMIQQVSSRVPELAADNVVEGKRA